VLLSVFGQLGDIAASILKRFSGVKNSGVIFGGHGGALDKSDAAIFNGFVLYLYIRFFM
jgi:phosphatidate cytidylyltransferase